MIKREFRLGTTSFIYPDHIIPNVRKTGRFFDEIELLVFESLPREVIPSAGDVQELAALGRDLSLGYNVHLPVDVSLTAETPSDRQKAADILQGVLERFAPLAPSSYTLHLEMDRDMAGGDERAAWQERAADGLERLAPRLDDPSRISVETLWYDPAVLAPLVRQYGHSLCADLGHHFKYGFGVEQTREIFDKEISIVHLHGVDLTGERPRDHLGLDRMANDHFDRVVGFLTGFKGTVSLEVFNYPNLDHSLKRLANHFTDIPVLERTG
ncbi:MAG: TIM barrel protein [Desulfobacter sp.]|nr:MAG: TIM barrel protein [Desulfobacter sp.]